MISAGRETQDVRLKFALRMGMAARSWRASSDQLAKDAGYEGCSLIPLYHLAAEPAGLTQVELSRRMRIAESSVVRILRPLLERELVARRRMIGDGRAWLIKLEPSGVAAMEAFEPHAAALRHALLGDMADEDIERASALLLVLTERLTNRREP